MDSLADTILPSSHTAYLPLPNRQPSPHHTSPITHSIPPYLIDSLAHTILPHHTQHTCPYLMDSLAPTILPPSHTAYPPLPI